MSCLLKSLFFQLFLVLSACQYTNDKTCPELHPMSQWDSIEFANIFYQTNYTIDSLFEIKPLSSFDTVISLRLGSGWGSFDYYANIYQHAGETKASLFQYVDTERFALNDSLLKQSKRGYSKSTEVNITKSVLEGILYLLDSSDYWCTRRHANQCSMTVDGKEWTLSVKVGNNTHSVNWTDCYFSKSDTGCINKCREMEIIAMQIFHAAGLPRNKHIVVHKDKNIGNDSILYWVYAPIFFPETQVYYKKQTLEDAQLTVLKNDKDWFNFLEVEEQYFDDTVRYVPGKIIWIK